MDTYSEAQCQSLAKTFVANDTWQTVTLICLRTQGYGNDPVYRNGSNLKYVDKTRRALWESVAVQYKQLTPAALTSLHDYYAQTLSAHSTRGSVELCAEALVADLNHHS